MFDVSFSELMVIAVVALVVIGPERLPRVARTAGHLIGRLQRYVSTVKSDINREMQLEELKRMQQDVQAEVSKVSQSVSHEMRDIETRFSQPTSSVSATPDAVSPAPTLVDARAVSEKGTAA